MKTLLLMRHAKSSWGDSSLTDHERPLNERGERDAPFMADLIARQCTLPELIVSSTAVRAAATARCVAEAVGVPLMTEAAIYDAGAGGLVEVVRGLEPAAATILMVGHNPGFEGLTAFLTGEPVEMPTAAVAVIDLEVDSWSDVTANSGTLRQLRTPKAEMGNN